MLDTIVTITLYDWTDEDTLTMAMEEIDRLERLLSVEKEGSDLYRLSEAAGEKWVNISPECQEVLTMAKEYWSLSEGHFDITAGPLIDLWSIRDGTGHYPSEEELQTTFPKISSERLQIGEGRAYLEEAGMKANLGAIAKGYIADKVKTLLVEAGVKHASIDLGRNLIFIGEKTDQSPFRVGVQSPLDERGELVQILLISGKSVVTAGINERNFEYEGVKYHHILDPFTGFPADTGVASVTIISDKSAMGDALSTTCLLLGEEKGLALIEKMPDVEALFIEKDGDKVMSSGFAAYLA
jgi:thiamine biosynthesis lipoprotein